MLSQTRVSTACRSLPIVPGHCPWKGPTHGPAGYCWYLHNPAARVHGGRNDAPPHVTKITASIPGLLDDRGQAGKLHYACEQKGCIPAAVDRGPLGCDTGTRLPDAHAAWLLLPGDGNAGLRCPGHGALQRLLPDAAHRCSCASRVRQCRQLCPRYGAGRSPWTDPAAERRPRHPSQL
jgi:hypothetical protein